MSKRWYQDKDGDTSSMRIIAMMAGVTGCVAVFAYIVGAFTGVMIDVQLAVAGAGMAGIGEVSKAWQAKSGG